MIEISKAVIQVILLFIVSRLSTREDKKDALHVVGKYDSVVNGIYNDMIRKETVATKHESQSLSVFADSTHLTHRPESAELQDKQFQDALNMLLTDMRDDSHQSSESDNELDNKMLQMLIVPKTDDSF